MLVNNLLWIGNGPTTALILENAKGQLWVASGLSDYKIRAKSLDRQLAAKSRHTAQTKTAPEGAAFDYLLIVKLSFVWQYQSNR